MLAHNYPNRVDKIQLISGLNNYYSMTNNTLLTGFSFRQMFCVVLFTSKDFSRTIFTILKKSCPTIPTTKPQNLKRQSM